eukprot:7252512-Prymnesium_polylepis.1
MVGDKGMERAGSGRAEGRALRLGARQAALQERVVKLDPRESAALVADARSCFDERRYIHCGAWPL